MEDHNEDMVDARSPLIPDESEAERAIPKTSPAVDQGVLHIAPSQPHASLYSRIPVSSATESSSPSRRSGIHYWGRIVICVLLIGSGAGAVGCASHALNAYHVTHLSSEFFLPLWPEGLDLRPTISVLAGGTVILIMALISLIASAFPSPGRRAVMLNTIFTVSVVLGLAAAVISTAYSAYINNHLNSSSSDTVESWTCLWYHHGDDGSPTGFGTVCRESHAARNLTAVCICLEALALGLAVEAWWLEGKAGKKNQG